MAPRISYNCLSSREDQSGSYKVLASVPLSLEIFASMLEGLPFEDMVFLESRCDGLNMLSQRVVLLRGVALLE